jgi:hypothetical protein
MGLVSAREIIPAGDVGDRHARTVRTPVAFPAEGGHCVGRVSRVIGIYEKSRVSKNFTEYSLVGSDYWHAGMLDLEQRKPQAFVT